MTATDLAHAEPAIWNVDDVDVDARPLEEEIFIDDHYEILRLRPDAERETIERVYSTLSGRFHPDTPGTGEPDTFLRIREAYETLSDPVRRAQYDHIRQFSRSSARFRLQGREFFAGVIGEQNRRLAALCLLYRQRTSFHESPGLTLLDLEQLTGCTREELTSALWYLCEKGWATFGDLTEYSITADGFDVVESRIEDRFEFRALATACYYGLPSNAIGHFYKQRAPQLTLCASPESATPPRRTDPRDNRQTDGPKNHGLAMPLIDVFKQLGHDRKRMNAIGITDDVVMEYFRTCGPNGEQRDQAFAALVKRFDLTPAESVYVGDVLDTCAQFREAQ